MRLFRLSWLFIGGTLLAFVTFLYIKTQAVDLEAHSRIHDDIRQIRHMDASLNRDLLKTKDGLLLHYDTLTASMKRLQRLQRQLKSDLASAGYAGRAEIQRALEESDGRLATKAFLLEDFKSRNAILRNSVKHLPQLANDLFERPESNDFDIYLILVTGAMVSEALGYNSASSSTLKGQLEEHIKYVRNVGSRYDGLTGQYFEWLTKHAEVIVSNQPRVNEMVKHMTSLSLDKSLTELSRVYESLHQARIAKAEHYRTYLYAYSLILLVFVAYIFTQLRESTAALKRTVKELNHQKFAMDQHAIVSITDVAGRITYANDKFTEISGYGRDELIGQDHRMINSGWHDKEFFRDMWRTIGHGEVWHGEIRNRASDGSFYWVSSTIVPFLDDRGKPREYISIRTDITRRKQIEDALFQAKERAQVTLESIGDAVITVDRSGVIDYMNPVAERLAGLSNEEARRHGPLMKIFDIVDEEEKSPLRSPLEPCLKNGFVVTLSTQLLVNRIDGREFAVEITIAPIHDRDDNIIGAVLAIHDVTTLRGMAKEISYQATHDALTGLTNRHEFERVLGRMYESARETGRSHVLCFMDLDQFKAVNDTCGHVAGDELLRQLSSVLKGSVRDRDTLARIGGDEFGILLGECTIDQARRITRELCDSITEYQFSWEGKSFRIGASIGLVEVNSDSENMAALMRAADSACYTAKQQGRSRIHVYQPGSDNLARRQGDLHWADRISRALAQDELELLGQYARPLHDDCRTAGYREVFVRLRDEGNLIQPMAFIPAAERYGMMPEVDRWVIRRVLSFCREMDMDGQVVGVNISGASINEDILPAFIEQQLSLNGVPAGALCLEVSAASFNANVGEVSEFVRALKTLGCRVAVDDVGSGLGSCLSVKDLPIDYMKIEGGMVGNIPQGEIDRTMVEAINKIGHVMDAETIAKNVESEAVLSQLRQLGVDYAQGFWIARPEVFPGAVWPDRESGVKV